MSDYLFLAFEMFIANGNDNNGGHCHANQSDGYAAAAVTQVGLLFCS